MTATQSASGMIEEDPSRAAREPKGFGLRYALAVFGSYYAILSPTLGGISVQLQGMVGVQEAPRILGITVALGSLMALITQPIAGRLSDNTTSRFGMRRPWIIAGSVGLAIGVSSIGLAQNLTALFLAWCFALICSNAIQGALFATVADQVPEWRRGSISALGGIAAPAAILSAAVSLSVLPTNFLRAAVPALVGASLCLFFGLSLKDRIFTGKATPVSIRSLLGSFYFNPLVYRDFGLAWITKALIMFGFASTSVYLTLFLASAFKMGVSEQLQFNVYATVCSVVAMGVGAVVGGRGSDRLGKRRIFVTLSGVLVGLGIVLTSTSPLIGAPVGLGLILLGSTITGLGFGVFISVDAALCIDVLPDPDTMAKDLGVLNIANTLPGTVAPFVAGSVVMPIANAIWPGSGYSIWFVLAGLIAISGGLLVLKIRSVP